MADIYAGTFPAGACPQQESEDPALLCRLWREAFAASGAKRVQCLAITCVTVPTAENSIDRVAIISNKLTVGNARAVGSKRTTGIAK